MPVWLVLILTLFVYMAVIFYLGWITAKWVLQKQSIKIKSIYIILMMVLSYSFILGTALDNDLLRVIGLYWMALLYVMFFSVPILHLLVFMSSFTTIPRLKAEKGAAIVLALVVIFVMAYGSYNAYQPVVRTYEVNIDKENPGINQLNIVMAADMHFGLLSNKNHATRLVEEINELEPDIVLFPGDIMDDRMKEFVEQGMGPILSDIQSTYGVYASLGNHDKGDIPELIAELEKNNIHVLYDDMIVIEDSVTLIGRKDRTEKDRQSVASLISLVDKSKTVILLDHQPYDLDIAEKAGVDLLVSGHTHRGQLAPFQYITDYLYENDWGHVQIGEMHSIVTSGFGFWGPPIRTGSRSEVVQIQVDFTN